MMIDGMSKCFCLSAERREVRQEVLIPSCVHTIVNGSQMREIGEMGRIGEMREMREMREKLLAYLPHLPHLPHLPYVLGLTAT
jgi:hypothetical protein